MRRFFRSFFKLDKRTRLPRLPKSLTRRYDITKLTDSELNILMLGLARDPDQAREIIKRYGTSNVDKLQRLLPKPKADWRGRLRRWLAKREGAHLSDPHRSEMREWQKLYGKRGEFARWSKDGE